jgi:hypothetical protein
LVGLRTYQHPGNKTNEMHRFLKSIFGIEFCVFRTGFLSIIRSFSLYTQQWYMSCRFADSLRASCKQTCMTYTIAVFTVKTQITGRNWITQFISTNKCSILTLHNKLQTNKAQHTVRIQFRSERHRCFCRTRNQL